MDRIDLRNRKIRIQTTFLSLFSFLLFLYSMNTVINSNTKHEIQSNIICYNDCSVPSAKDKKLITDEYKIHPEIQ